MTKWNRKFVASLSIANNNNRITSTIRYAKHNKLQWQTHAHMGKHKSIFAFILNIAWILPQKLIEIYAIFHAMNCEHSCQNFQHINLCGVQVWWSAEEIWRKCVSLLHSVKMLTNADSSYTMCVCLWVNMYWLRLSHTHTWCRNCQNM